MTRGWKALALFAALAVSPAAIAMEPDEGDGTLPWTRRVYAQGEGASQSTARYQAESNLRREVDRERWRCQADKGHFQTYQGFTRCRPFGNRYRCESDATCYCRELEDAAFSDDIEDVASPIFADRRDCQAIVFGNSGMCRSADCRAIVLDTVAYCRTRDCRGIVMRVTSYCETRDCKAVVLDNVGYCQTSNCRALIWKNSGLCR